MGVRLSPLALPAALLSKIRSAGSGSDTYTPLCPALPVAGASSCFFGRQLGELCQQIRENIDFNCIIVYSSMFRLNLICQFQCVIVSKTWRHSIVASKKLWQSKVKAKWSIGRASEGKWSQITTNLRQNRVKARQSETNLSFLGIVFKLSQL